MTKDGRGRAEHQGAGAPRSGDPPLPDAQHQPVTPMDEGLEAWLRMCGHLAADAVLRNLRATGAFDQGSMETPTGPNREPLARERKKSRQCEPLPRAEGALGRIH